MDIEIIVALALLFVTLVYVARFSIRLTLGVGEAKRRPVSEAEMVANPLYRFVSPERLFQLTMTTGVISGGVLMAVLLLAGAPVLLVVPVGILTGLITSRIPKACYVSRVRLRRELFDRRLMDLTMGLANGLLAGVSLPQAMETVSRDLGGPIAEEFGHLLQEHRFGKAMPECLEHLANRMPSEELRLLTTSIRISIQTGGSLAEMMNRIAETIRYRLDFKERLKTMTAQGRFEAMAMGSAPIFVLIILSAVNREMIMPLFTTHTGWVALGCVVILECLGFFFINKIVTIEV